MAKQGASSRVAAIVIKLDRRSGVPLYLQISEAIRRAATAGAVRAGTSLPSTRALASELGVSRNTVMQAYEELSSHGLVRGRRGARTQLGISRKTVPLPLDWRVLLERSGYPNKTIDARDPDGTPLYAFTPIVRRQVQPRRKS